MDLQKDIIKEIDKNLGSDMVTKAIKENVQKCVDDVIKDIFKWGKAKDIIKDKLNSVLIPQLEGYNYSEYIIKLDDVLTKIMKNTTIDNKKILGNFKKYMLEKIPNEIKVSKIFDEYYDFVSKNISTNNLEVDYEENPTYKNVTITMEIDNREDRAWSGYKNADMYLECKEDDEINFHVELTKWKDNDYWTLSYKTIQSITSLRRLNEFEIFLMQLSENGTHIIMDETYMKDEDVEIEAEPEVYFE